MLELEPLPSLSRGTCDRGSGDSRARARVLRWVRLRLCGERLPLELRTLHTEGTVQGVSHGYVSSVRHSHERARSNHEHGSALYLSRVRGRHRDHGGRLAPGIRFGYTHETRARRNHPSGYK